MPRHVGPVAFTLDGVTYEIDLSTKNANKLRAAFEAPDRSRTAGGEHAKCQFLVAAEWVIDGDGRDASFVAQQAVLQGRCAGGGSEERDVDFACPQGEFGVVDASDHQGGVGLVGLPAAHQRDGVASECRPGESHP